MCARWFHKMYILVWCGGCTNFFVTNKKNSCIYDMHIRYLVSNILYISSNFARRYNLVSLTNLIRKVDQNVEDANIEHDNRMYFKVRKFRG